MLLLQLVFLLIIAYSIYHMWQHVDQPTGKRILFAVLMFFLYGWIVYWIWFLIRRPEKRNELGGFTSNSSGGGNPKGDTLVARLEQIFAESGEPKDRMDRMAELIAREVLFSDASIKDKCLMLESVNAYTRQFNPFTHNYIHVSSIYNAYYLLEQATGSMLFESSRTQIKNQFSNGQLTSLTEAYLGVLSAAGSISQGGRSFSLKSDTLTRYDLPTIRQNEPEAEVSEQQPLAESSPANTPPQHAAADAEAPTTAAGKVKVRKVKRPANK